MINNTFAEKQGVGSLRVTVAGLTSRRRAAGWVKY